MPSSNGPTVLELPNEIVQQILSHFVAADNARTPRSDIRTYCSLCYLSNLYNCCLISRCWSAATTALLYSKLKLDLDGNCDYHWRGIPWGDGVSWRARRGKYLKHRYLQPLLRTLSLNPCLGDQFRVLEVDLHYYIAEDLELLPLYTKLLSLCPNLTTVIGDPCIFFSPLDPPRERRLTRRALNFVYNRLFRNPARRRNSHTQKQLWAALGAHKAWESWEWISSCHLIYFVDPRGFYNLHTNWKNLKHMTLSGFHPQGVPGSNWDVLRCLDSLESLSLMGTSTGLLYFMPANKLVSLSIQCRYRCYCFDFFNELACLWAYLSRTPSGGQSQQRLTSLELEVPKIYASLAEKAISHTLTLTPNLRDLVVTAERSDFCYQVTLYDDTWLSRLPALPHFPRSPELRRLVFFCPGWSRNWMLAKLLDDQRVFPRLECVEYLRSTDVLEFTQGDPKFFGHDCPRSRFDGMMVDMELEHQLSENRGLVRVDRSSVDWSYLNIRRSILADWRVVPDLKVCWRSTATDRPLVEF